MAKETRKAAKRSDAANGPLEANGEAFVVRALAKGLAMLSLFDAERREWTLDEMVAELKLPRMTGYRMARTLQSAGYLVTDPQSGRYRLGPALIASTYLSEGYAELVAIARPYLETLGRRDRRIGHARGRRRRCRCLRRHAGLSAAAQSARSPWAA